MEHLAPNTQGRRGIEHDLCPSRRVNDQRREEVYVHLLRGEMRKSKRSLLGYVTPNALGNKQDERVWVRSV